MTDRCRFMRAQSTHWDLAVSTEITDPVLFVSLLGPIRNGNRGFSAQQPDLHWVVYQHPLAISLDQQII